SGDGAAAAGCLARSRSRPFTLRPRAPNHQETSHLRPSCRSTPGHFEPSRKQATARATGINGDRPMKMAFYGSSLLSSYWNGAATYYRGLLKALAARGYDITFYEP